MNRFRMFVPALLALALSAPALAVNFLDVVEMKVKVYATPEQVARIAPDVLEFYNGGEGWFVGAVTQPTYEELVREGFDIDVLVRGRARGGDAVRRRSSTPTPSSATPGPSIAQNHPSICRLDTIGHSFNGNLILAMKISDNVNADGRRAAHLLRLLDSRQREQRLRNRPLVAAPDRQRLRLRPGHHPLGERAGDLAGADGQPGRADFALALQRQRRGLQP